MACFRKVSVKLIDTWKRVGWHFANLSKYKGKTRYVIIFPMGVAVCSGGSAVCAMINILCGL